MDAISKHAHLRCAQRHINESTVDVVLRYGREINRTGVTFYFLGRRDIPEDLRRQDRYARLEGTTLLLSPEGTVVTVYRNRTGLSKIRKKAKYRLTA